jgi:Fic family protein
MTSNTTAAAAAAAATTAATTTTNATNEMNSNVALSDVVRLLDALESEMATLLTHCDADLSAIESNAVHAVHARERIESHFQNFQAVANDFAAINVPSGADAARVLVEAKQRADVPAAQIARIRRQLVASQRAIATPSTAANELLR